VVDVLGVVVDAERHSQANADRGQSDTGVGEELRPACVGELQDVDVAAVLALSWTDEVDGDHIAVAFGPDANAIDGAPPAAVEEVLRQWLPDAEVLDVATHSWTHDPVFRGTWAVPGPGQLRSQIEAVELRDGRVLLAGADLALGSYALIDGAINTGIRAGRDASALVGIRA
jgi:monoamine oxidase